MGLWEVGIQILLVEKLMTCYPQGANTSPAQAESGPPPCSIQPGTSFLPGGSTELLALVKE